MYRLLTTTPLAILAIGLVLAAAACGGSSTASRSIKVARSSNSLFSIFPSHRSSAACEIPHGGTAAASRQPVRGLCSTDARARGSRTIVTFREIWNGVSMPRPSQASFNGEHTWRVTVVGHRVEAVVPSGDFAPQLMR